MLLLTDFQGHHLRGNVDQPAAPLPGDYTSNERAFDSLAPVTNPDSDARFIMPEDMRPGTDEWIFSASVVSGVDALDRLRRFSIFATRKVSGSLCPLNFISQRAREQPANAVVAVRDLDSGRVWQVETKGHLLTGKTFAFESARGLWKMRSILPANQSGTVLYDKTAALIPSTANLFSLGGAEYAINAGAFRLNAVLNNLKPAVAHGEAGRYRNNQLPGFPLLTRYASRTRQYTDLEFQTPDEYFRLSGLTWSDHQSSYLNRMLGVLSWQDILSYASRLGDIAANWQWIPIQLDDGSELNLFTVWNSKTDPERQFNGGFYLSPTGEKTNFGLRDFIIKPRADSVTKQGDLMAPNVWDVNVIIPGRGRLDLVLKTFCSLNDIKLVTLKTQQDAIEAAVSVEGRWVVQQEKSSQSIRGTGWVEIILLDPKRLIQAWGGRYLN